MHFRSGWRRGLAVLVILVVILVGVAGYLSLSRPYVLMATTTSTRDTGLLDLLLPAFTAESGIEVRYTAVGTGLALDAGRRGDVDVVMVHSPAQEQAFMDSGAALCRNPLMYNRFVVVGPRSDPAGVRNATDVVDSLRRIHGNASRFESRGDNSGTHAKEAALWALAGLNTSAFGGWYETTDQGMGATLTIANERDAYTLSDDGTWYAREGTLPFLALAYGADEAVLRNPYSIIVVSPALRPGRAVEPSLQFARWLAEPRGQGLISEFAVNGHAIFTRSGSGTC